MIYLPSATLSRQGYVFTGGFCSQGGGVSQHVLGQTTPGQTPLSRHPLTMQTPWQSSLGRHPLPSACWDTHPPAQCMLGYTPPCPVLFGIHTLLPSVILGYTSSCPVHAGIHTTLLVTTAADGDCVFYPYFQGFLEGRSLLVVYVFTSPYSLRGPPWNEGHRPKVRHETSVLKVPASGTTRTQFLF